MKNVTGRFIVDSKSFIIHKDSLGILDCLTDEQAGKLFKAIRNYQDRKDIDIDDVINLAFFPFKAQFERDNEKYEKICNRNRTNGLKGGRPITQKTQSVIDNPKKADSKNKNDNDNKKDNDNNINKPSPKSVSGVPYSAIVDLYHEKLPTLPRIEKLTATRKSQIKQRWVQKDIEDLSEWENFFDYVSKSKFLMGGSTPVNGHRVFTANLEWLTKETNFVKITEGNYH